MSDPAEPPSQNGKEPAVMAPSGASPFPPLLPSGVHPFWTEPLKPSNLDNYVPDGFRSRHLPAPRLAKPKPPDTEPALTSSQYEHFWRFHLHRENQAQALYNHRRIEIDDVVRLCQYQETFNGGPIPVFDQVTQRPSWRFTSFTFDARVLLIDRLNKLIILKADGMTPGVVDRYPNGSGKGCALERYAGARFHVQFLPSFERFASMDSAFSHVHGLLNEGVENDNVSKRWIQSMLFPEQNNSEELASATCVTESMESLEIDAPPLNREQRMAVDTFMVDVTYRLKRPQHTQQIPSLSRQYCYYQMRDFRLTPFERAMNRRVAVTTYRDASILVDARMTNTDLRSVASMVEDSPEPSSNQVLLWAALLIDDAAQVTEPETLIPLSVVAPPNTTLSSTFLPVVVMAGDQHFLNPYTYTPGPTPMKTSLFARLLKEAPSTTTTLVKNYHSHHSILALVSTLYYRDTLEACADPTMTSRLLNWDGWRDCSMPILFHDNNWQPNSFPTADAAEAPNPAEVEIAVKYARQLLATKLVSPPEVCIISPFQKQTDRIRKTLACGPREGWDILAVSWNVDSIEESPGNYGVVILCTTRYDDRFLKEDRELGAGMIGMPNKLYAALTKASCGLILIGSKQLLVEKDPDWKRLIEFCEQKGLVASGSPAVAEPVGAEAKNQDEGTDAEDSTLG
ncbi:AAA domain-containing protein [Podospora australis]|uniref:AAA domain-containing protein n=1 Tax=Podospora australis TaxID=1536484 RepID=A0AAN6WJJ4_9PEZI|nr:AAA domain-containing protein [Podospora australis]